jgi:hypothetical protein
LAACYRWSPFFSTKVNCSDWALFLATTMTTTTTTMKSTMKSTITTIPTMLTMYDYNSGLTVLLSLSLLSQ